MTDLVKRLRETAMFRFEFTYENKIRIRDNLDEAADRIEELERLVREFTMVADAVEPHWRGAGETLRAGWIIELFAGLERENEAAADRIEELERMLSRSMCHPAIETLSFCTSCGVELEEVRPGSHQHPATGSHCPYEPR